MSKVWKDGNLASKIFIFVDYKRSLGLCDMECCNVMRYFSYKCDDLGIQNAPMNRKGPYQRQGQWAGSTLHTSDGLEGILSQEKWNKIENIYRKVANMLSTAGKLLRKDLILHQGFLLYYTRTNMVLNPHLKGLQLTVDYCRPYRDSKGWKLQSKKLLGDMYDRKILDWEEEA